MARARNSLDPLPDIGEPQTVTVDNNTDAASSFCTRMDIPLAWHTPLAFHPARVNAKLAYRRGPDCKPPIAKSRTRRLRGRTPCEIRP